MARKFMSLAEKVYSTYAKHELGQGLQMSSGPTEQ